MCKYTPLEIMAGFGVQTERLERVQDAFDAADTMAHPNICGYGKVLLEACLQPGVEEVILVNCCDVARRIYDILKEQGHLKFLWLLDLPHRQGKAESWMLAHSLYRLVQAYEAYSGIPFHTGKAAQALAEQANAAQKPENAPETQPCISLQGAHGGPYLLEMVQKHFSVPVRDDTCSGNRRLEQVSGADSRSAWLDAYAQVLLRQQVPCMRMNEREARRPLGQDAMGIVYHTMKFCDYYGFEYAARTEKDIPVLKIETDATRQSGGQLATRLDAFAESLRAGAGRSVEARSGQEGQKKLMEEKMYAAGIDSGSSSTDVVIMNRDKEIAAWSILRTGAGAARGAERALEEALQKAGIPREALGNVVATGYGRDTIGLGDDAVTEITCHAKGAHFLDPAVRTIIDIGGQDSKVIRIDADGNVKNFTMNDKCAAGTGRFLEMMARTLELSMDEFEQLGQTWKNDLTISSMCTVFAESEVVSLIAANADTADIIHGLNKSVAAKTAALARRIGVEAGCMMTGGVAKNAGLVAELEKKMEVPVTVSEHAQLCGAIGAALIALEQNA